MKSSLQIIRLKKKIAEFQIEANLKVSGGERVAITGPSGCGKTTLLRAIAGLEEIDEGEIFLSEKKLNGLPPEKRNIGFLFQENALFSHLSVFENIAFGPQVRGWDRKRIQKEAQAWLHRVGLEHRAHSRISTLSGGERQRVAWARALIWKPEVLLLDEPFTALDSQLKTELRSQLLDLHREWPVPMILVSHDWSDVRELSTREIPCQIQGGTHSFLDPGFPK